MYEDVAEFVALALPVLPLVVGGTPVAVYTPVGSPELVLSPVVGV